MSTTMAASAEFQDGGKPVAQPVYTVDVNGNPVSPAGSSVVGSIGTQANPLATNQVVGTPVVATQTAAAALQCQSSLPAITGKTTYLNGFVCTAHAPATNVFGTVTVSLDSGTTVHMNFVFLESSTIGGMLNIDFPDPIPAKNPNTSIVITIPAITSGAATAITAFGYQI